MNKIHSAFPLEGAKNVRELGGYFTKDNKKTNSHTFIQSDALHNLTENDCQYLFDYGVRLVIDFRGQGEIDREPDKLQLRFPEIKTVHIPLQDAVHGKRYQTDFPPSMWELYQWLLEDSKEGFYKVFMAFLSNLDHVTLFHCAGGKDRTGMVAMLLLKLAEVDDETIIDHYSQTEQNMKEIFKVQTKNLESLGLVVPNHIMESPPENMIKTLNFFNNKYKSANEYLLEIGINQSQIENIKSKFISQN